MELLEAEPGQTIELEDVLLVENDGDLKVGTPTVEGAKVRARVQGEVKGPKIRIFKLKRRKRYRLRAGHRQHYTRIRIESIEV